MPKEKSPESLVDDLVETQPSRPTRCRICAMENVDDVNRAIRRFHELKTSGETTQPWRDLHRHVLVPKFDVKVTSDSILHHARNHLGLS